MRAQFRAWRNRTTIHKQLSIVVGLLVALLILCLTLYSYFTQARANTRSQTEFLSRLLTLESEALDDYISELAAYSLQLRNDDVFMDIITMETPIDYSQRQALEDSFKTYFYSRGDIQEMDLYLLRQSLRLRMDSSRRKVLGAAYEPIETMDDCAEFTAPPNYLSIRPSKGGILTLTRTIIDSPRTTPLAVVRFVVTPDRIDSLIATHLAQDEHIYLFDTDGTPLSDDGTEEQIWEASRSGETQITLDGSPCVLVSCEPSVNNLVLVVTKPTAVVNAALIHTRNTALLLGIVALVFTVALVLCSIRVLTSPLTALASWLQRTGSGNFDGRADLQGSYEMTGLSAEVNRMMSDISDLINRSYVATINERTAQLAALEAQTNPHFLFNTLQAIATEAIVSGNERLYQMVSALGALLRYSIKGGNLAALETEMQYVEKYIFLQRARFGDRLDFYASVDDELLPLTVPKLGLLSLVENSIVHGMKGSDKHIHIRVECSIRGKNVGILVRDDGSGISPGKLEELRRTLSGDPVVLTQSIGLGNLASRLRLLYRGCARIRIESSQIPPNNTTVELLIPMEELRNAQDTDR